MKIILVISHSAVNGPHLMRVSSVTFFVFFSSNEVQGRLSKRVTFLILNLHWGLPGDSKNSVEILSTLLEDYFLLLKHMKAVLLQ